MTHDESPRRFEVDGSGFKGHVGKMKPHQVIQEIISNSFDENSVKTVICEIKYIQEKRQVQVKVNDDGDGFRDIEEIFTLYKHSYKRDKPEKRGRFNLGDKQFFAVAETGHVITGDKKVEFTEYKRIIDDHEKIKGVEVVGNFKWSATVLNPTIRELYKIIVPQDKKLVINDKTILPKKLIKTIEAVLRTEMENAEGIMEEFDRKTKVELYEKQDNEQPLIFELGIPVQKLEDNVDWHVNVMQKIPLRTERDVVSEAYLKKLYGAIINNATELITEDNAGSSFVQMAMIHADADTAKHVFKKALGTDKVFIESTVDGYANDCVKEIGGMTLKNGFLDRDTRSHLMEIGALESATEKFGSKGIETLTPFVMTEGMENTIKLTKQVAREVLGKEIECIVVSTNGPQNADYNKDGLLRWNVKMLGKSFFDKISTNMVRIIIHELSHDAQHEDCITSSHYSTAFVTALQMVGSSIGMKGIRYYATRAGLPNEFIVDV